MKLREALLTAQALGNEKLMADAFSGLAVAYHTLDNYGESEIFYREAIKLSESVYGRHERLCQQPHQLSRVTCHVERVTTKLKPFSKKQWNLPKKLLRKRTFKLRSYALIALHIFLQLQGVMMRLKLFIEKLSTSVVETFGRKVSIICWFYQQLSEFAKENGALR